MAQKVFTEEETNRAIELAEKLREKIENNFAKLSDDKVIEEMKAIREELLRMGFFVSYTISIKDLSNPEQIEADVSLWRPKYIN